MLAAKLVAQDFIPFILYILGVTLWNWLTHINRFNDTITFSSTFYIKIRCCGLARVTGDGGKCIPVYMHTMTSVNISFSMDHEFMKMGYHDSWVSECTRVCSFCKEKILDSVSLYSNTIIASDAALISQICHLIGMHVSRTLCKTGNGLYCFKISIPVSQCPNFHWRKRSSCNFD